MIGVPGGVTMSRLQPETFGGDPRTPRVQGGVDHHVVAPVPVDLRHGDPASADEPWLGGVFDREPTLDRYGGSRVGRPPVGGAVLGCHPHLASWHAGQPGTGGRVRSVRVSALAHQVLFEGVAEQVAVGVVARHGKAVQRYSSAVRGRAERHARQGGPVVRREVGAHRMPPEAVGWGGVVAVLLHLRPEHPQAIAVQFAAQRPVPGGAFGAGPVADLERHRHLWATAVLEAETGAGLHHRGVVHERGPAQAGGGARPVEEGVLEQPEVPVATEWVDVLVVPTEHRADPVGQEPVERRGARRRTADVGGHLAVRCGGGERRPGRDGSGRRRHHHLGRWRYGPTGHRRRVGVDRGEHGRHRGGDVVGRLDGGRLDGGRIDGGRRRRVGGARSGGRGEGLVGRHVGWHRWQSRLDLDERDIDGSTGRLRRRGTAGEQRARERRQGDRTRDECATASGARCRLHGGTLTSGSPVRPSAGSTTPAVHPMITHPWAPGPRSAVRAQPGNHRPPSRALPSRSALP